MLDTLITSKTRIKLLLKFFLNSATETYLRNMEGEFNESTNAIRLELNRFENAGMLHSRIFVNKKYFKADTKHPLFYSLNDMVLKHVGIAKVIENVIKKIGDVDSVYLVGELAKGLGSKIIDIIRIGEGIDKSYLVNLVDKAEKVTSRSIRYLVYSSEDFVDFREKVRGYEPLLLWGKKVD